MQAAQQFVSQRWGRDTTASPSPQTAGQAGPSGTTSALSKLSTGMSVVASLSQFAQTMQASRGLSDGARAEEFAANTDFIQAQEKATAINSQFALVQDDMLAAASANGIDLTSGSLTEARSVARQTADREVRTVRNNAETSMAVRRARAVAMREQAKAGRLLGVIKLGMDVAGAVAKGGQGG